MTVYVDDVRHAFGRMILCHMWADSLPELLAMADLIGVQRRWLQQPPRASWVHFDIALVKKSLAIAAGAVLTDRFGPVEHVARLNGNRQMLDMVAKSRAMRAETAAGRFPQPVSISAGRVAWDRRDLDDWYDRKSGRTTGSESDWLK
jgi:predicted DNA-binding transcriptional regulator AlpA